MSPFHRYFRVSRITTLDEAKREMMFGMTMRAFVISANDHTARSVGSDPRLWRALTEKTMYKEALDECRKAFAFLGYDAVPQAEERSLQEPEYREAMQAAAQRVLEQSKTRYLWPPIMIPLMRTRACMTTCFAGWKKAARIAIWWPLSMGPIRCSTGCDRTRDALHS